MNIRFFFLLIFILNTVICGAQETIIFISPSSKTNSLKSDSYTNTTTKLLSLPFIDDF